MATGTDTVYTEATFDRADDSSLFTKLGTGEVAFTHEDDNTLPEYIGHQYRFVDDWKAAAYTVTEWGLQRTFSTSTPTGPVRALSFSFAVYFHSLNLNPAVGGNQDRVAPYYLELHNVADGFAARLGGVISHHTDGQLYWTLGTTPALGTPFVLNGHLHEWLTVRCQFLNFDFSGFYVSAYTQDIFGEVDGEPVLLSRQSIPAANMGFLIHHAKTLTVGCYDAEAVRDTFDIRVDEIRIWENFKANTTSGGLSRVLLPRQRQGGVRSVFSDVGESLAPEANGILLEDQTGSVWAENGGLATGRLIHEAIPDKDRILDEDGDRLVAEDDSPLLK